MFLGDCCLVGLLSRRVFCKIMDMPVIVATITAVASVFVAILTFWFTKQKEREAEVRKQKT